MTPTLSGVVVLDTNAYRRMGRGKTRQEAKRKGAGIAARDRALGLQALAHPIVIMELASHLGDVTDPEWHDCRSALIVMWEHCLTTMTGREMLATMNDPETMLCRLAYQTTPQDHQAITEALATLCRRIATLDDDSIVAAIGPELTQWAAFIGETETGFVTDMAALVRFYELPASNGDSGAHTLQSRAEMIAHIESSDFLYRAATANVVKARLILGLQEADPDWDQRVKMVQEVFAASLHLYRAICRKVLIDGVDIAKTKYRNWIWDLNIAMSAGGFTVAEGLPVRFVSDDGEVVRAISSAGFGHLVCSFNDYSELLRNGAPAG